jgi:predicted  nucleic acid-binding Zn-ribbon protein
VLLANENQEYNAEKDLKTYATEQERQQIFLFESQRFNFATQIKDIDEKKDPALKMEKNKTLLEIGNWQTRLNSIVEQEKKLEDEQKLIAQKEQTSAIPSERKSLSERKWDLDKGIQDIEKKRWEVEKQIQDYEAKIKIFDQSSGQLVVEKNNLRDKMLGIDKSLREIYSGVIARIEERRRGEAADQKARRELLEKAQAEKNEQIQRAQYSGRAQAQQKGILSKVPEALKDKLAKTESAEEEQRKKFLQEVDQGTNKNIGQQQQKSNT